MIKNFIKDESGATAVEYGLIAALVSVASIVGLRILGGELSASFAYIQCQMSGAANSTCEAIENKMDENSSGRAGDSQYNQGKFKPQ